MKKIILNEQPTPEEVQLVSQNAWCDFCKTDSVECVSTDSNETIAVPAFRSLGFKYVIENYKSVRPFCGDSYRKVIGEPKYEVVYVSTANVERHKVQVDICFNCIKQLAALIPKTK